MSLTPSDEFIIKLINYRTEVKVDFWEDLGCRLVDFIEHKFNVKFGVGPDYFYNFIDFIGEGKEIQVGNDVYNCTLVKRCGCASIDMDIILTKKNFPPQHQSVYFAKFSQEN